MRLASFCMILFAAPSTVKEKLSLSGTKQSGSLWSRGIGGLDIVSTVTYNSGDESAEAVFALSFWIIAFIFCCWQHISSNLSPLIISYLVPGREWTACVCLNKYSGSRRSWVKQLRDVYAVAVIIDSVLWNQLLCKKYWIVDGHIWRLMRIAESVIEVFTIMASCMVTETGAAGLPNCLHPWYGSKHLRRRSQWWILLSVKKVEDNDKRSEQALFEQEIKAWVK